MRVVSACAVVLGLILTTTACSEKGKPVAGSTPTSTTTSSSSTKKAEPAGDKKMGKTLTITDETMGYSAAITLESVTTATKGGPPIDIKPESGTFVILELTFEGKKGKFPVNPLYFHLITPDGKDIDQMKGNGMLASPPDDLEAADLLEGKTVKGRVALDAKLDPGTKIVITDVLDKPAGEWVL
ncbi:hypothetical protein Lesp02_13480 [Lentzea sp. NBRC 105346]|uniref:hypothetical protein n=1 Tax=Lentzea sp. NBRC 105346 TaxID=3032205 RepID=UPI0024A22630|nr:hypothetical protein [Lentzea sp. NBRC 105346]GLZ29158.1 hypothetical protein Lesp02_13480 [Lentzea sp. NBRC 105346]